MPMIEHKKKRGAVMTAPNKRLFYISRIIHVILLPVLCLSIIWYPNDKWWEFLGIPLLIFVSIYSKKFIKNENLLFSIRVFTYLLISIIYFPLFFYKENTGLDYTSIIFFDMIFLFIVDCKIFLNR